MDYQLDKALSDFQRAIVLDPRTTAAYEGRGRIWGKRGEHAKVVANFAELARMAPTTRSGTASWRGCSPPATKTPSATAGVPWVRRPPRAG